VNLLQYYDKPASRPMRYGMPPNGGFAVGIDRLTTLLTNQTMIREMILFPYLRRGDAFPSGSSSRQK
jgi:lysyl-tRNA synthetase, class II